MYRVGRETLHTHSLCTANVFHRGSVFVVDVIASRGERLELLVDKTEDLSNSVCPGFYCVD